MSIPYYFEQKRLDKDFGWTSHQLRIKYFDVNYQILVPLRALDKIALTMFLEDLEHRRVHYPNEFDAFQSLIFYTQHLWILIALKILSKLDTTKGLFEQNKNSLKNVPIVL